jgi:hypothetical protein
MSGALVKWGKNAKKRCFGHKKRGPFRPRQGDNPNPSTKGMDFMKNEPCNYRSSIIHLTAFEYICQ